MSSIKVSAPAKLMLFGEHSVVHNHPCIVTAVDQRLYLEAEKIIEPTFVLDAPQIGIKNYTKPIVKLRKNPIKPGAAFVEFAVSNFLRSHKQLGGIRIKTKSNFSSKFGFGSSSAAAVATIAALSKLYNVALTKKQIFDLAYMTVLDVQRAGSGFDVAAAVYGGTIYFTTGGKQIIPLKITSLPLIVGYTGIKASTTQILHQTEEKEKKYPKLITTIYKNIEEIVDEAKTALEKKNWKNVGDLMNINQGYLEALGVSSPKLSAMIYAAREAGAYGAKLSGAGVGDCMIALGNHNSKFIIQNSIKGTGGQIINVKVNEPGVRVEK